jgi:CHAD domain-containing protein
MVQHSVAFGALQQSEIEVFRTNAAMTEASTATQADYADGLTRVDPLFLLAGRILKCELGSLQAHLRPEHGSPVADEIHEARIAVRRIRVGLRVFRGFMPAQAEEFRIEFRWLGQGLGDARDLDVYMESLQANEGDATAIPKELERNINRERKGASDRLRALLLSERFAQLLAEFATFVDTELPPSVQRRWRSLQIRDAVHGDVRKSLARVLKLGRKIDAESPPEKLHKLRIRAKRLRYETEFYSDFYPRLRDLTRGAKRLQDVLGAYRDACSAADRLSEFARDAYGGARKNEPIAALIRVQNEHAAAARRRFPAAWRRFEKTAAATKLGRKRS